MTNGEEFFLEWHVALDYTIKPVSTEQPVITINGLFPGPLINCSTNDLIHEWHTTKAQFMARWSLWDKLPNTTWFKLDLRIPGGFGPIRVNNRIVINVPFPKPEAEYDLLIGDWYSTSYKATRSMISDDPPSSLPDFFLMNGKGPYGNPASTSYESFTVTKGKTYRFRISNVGTTFSFNFRIQNHKMLLVETEGSYPVQITLDSLDVHVGQSYSDEADFYMVASPLLVAGTDTLTGVGVLHYSNSFTNVTGPLPEGPDPFDLDSSVNQARAVRWNLTVGAARPNRQGAFNVTNVTLSQTFVLVSSMPEIGGAMRYAVNNISYNTPSTPLKLADQFNRSDDVYKLDWFSANSTNPEAVAVVFVATGIHKGWAEFVFVNSLDVMDAWHLDGFGFYVVGFGEGEWEPEARNTYNLYDPVVRSTVQVYPKGWTAVYAFLDNPGMWNIRSQNLKHWYLGEELYVRVYSMRSLIHPHLLRSLPNLSQNLLLLLNLLFGGGGLVNFLYFLFKVCLFPDGISFPLSFSIFSFNKIKIRLKKVLEVKRNIFYEWHVALDATIKPVSTDQPVITINGMFPGPLINATTDDNIHINVINHMDEPILSGIQQRLNSWQDGVTGTNCPIQPGTNWTYVFQVKDQIGTFSYFPSINFQKAAGGFGTIRVNNRETIPVPFVEPEAEFDLLVGDWFQKSYKTYRFRITNVGTTWSFNFRIQSHQMVLVELEGSYNNKIILDSLDVHVGQSYSILVTANQNVADYYIVASPKLVNADTSNNNVVGIGVLHYSNSTTNASGPLPDGPDPFDMQFSLNQAKSIRWNMTAGAARPNRQGSFNVTNVTLSQTFILTGSRTKIDDLFRYTINNISYLTPDTPLKLADYFVNGSGIYELDKFSTNSSNGKNRYGTFVSSGIHRGWTELVLKNDLDAIDSWHLDGFSVYVVGFGDGDWTPESRHGYNLNDPVVRSTVQVYPKKWTAVYVYFDNPGMWNLRSQVLKNWYLGEELYIRVYDPDRNSAKERPLPNNCLFCGLISWRSAFSPSSSLAYNVDQAEF
ncbi:hypothetical protein Tsubulata_016550 [Turnera subulata]|uniref:Monocopper oxidase-like protein SKU5 n=1 Tax=Turnera subulata TaxID=218843 RepID=A0A9Q0FGA2_9ROSI|nr:hypothetical protein Tsubulata_016550 [Turnera subulata]